MECPACTFVNVDAVSECEMCFTPFSIAKKSKKKKGSSSSDVVIPLGPDLSSDALFKELEMEEAVAAAAAADAPHAETCLICRARMTHYYFVLPACSQEHRYCESCMTKLIMSSVSQSRKRRQRMMGGPSSSNNKVSVDCALCGMQSLLVGGDASALPPLRRMCNGSFPNLEESSLVCSICLECVDPLHQTSSGHEVLSARDLAARLRPVIVGESMQRLEQKKEKLSVLRESYLAEKLGEVETAERESISRLEEGVARLMQLLQAKQTELTESFRMLGQKKREFIAQETVRLGQGVEQVDRALACVAGLASVSDSVAPFLRSHKETFNTVQSASEFVEDTRPNMAPVNFFPPSPFSLLEAILKGLKMKDPSTELDKGYSNLQQLLGMDAGDEFDEDDELMDQDFV